VFYNTGARVSEIVGLNVDDVDLDRGRSIRVLAKGRKLRQRATKASAAHRSCKPRLHDGAERSV